jgi:hypothetical protein
MFFSLPPRAFLWSPHYLAVELKSFRLITWENWKHQEKMLGMNENTVTCSPAAFNVAFRMKM